MNKVIEIVIFLLICLGLVYGAYVAIDLVSASRASDRPQIAQEVQLTETNLSRLTQLYVPATNTLCYLWRSDGQTSISCMRRR